MAAGVAVTERGNPGLWLALQFTNDITQGASTIPTKNAPPTVKVHCFFSTRRAISFAAGTHNVNSATTIVSVPPKGVPRAVISMNSKATAATAAFGRQKAIIGQIDSAPSAIDILGGGDRCQDLPTLRGESLTCPDHQKGQTIANPSTKDSFAIRNASSLPQAHRQLP